MTRFDYVRYDDISAQKQVEFKEVFTKVAKLSEQALPKGRAQSLVLTKLEEAYMWVGKAIRDEQVGRLGDDTDQPHRSNE